MDFYRNDYLFKVAHIIDLNLAIWSVIIWKKKKNSTKQFWNNGALTKGQKCGIPRKISSSGIKIIDFAKTRALTVNTKYNISIALYYKCKKENYEYLYCIKNVNWNIICERM